MNNIVLTPVPLEGGFSPDYRPGPFEQLPRSSLPPHTQTRSRRRHAAVALIASLSAFILFSFLAFHGYIAWTLAHPYVAPLTSNPKLAKNLDYIDVSFPSASGKSTVNGWYIPAQSDSGRTVVFSHGYGANREETWVPMYDLANLLHGLKYNVLMFDYGYASAENPMPATGGVEESQQLLAAVAYAKSQGAGEIVVWGFSMGAGTALQAALQTKDISAMILDSMFIADAETLYYNLTQYAPLPRNPSLPLIEWMLPLWTGFNLSAIPSQEVKTTEYDMPIYMIHGTKDAKAPVGIAETIAANQTNPLSSAWIVPKGKHELLFQVYPKEYMRRAVVFLSQVNQTLDLSTT
ncbi:alpha/beta hydrolase [Paenibacillus darwinianus]|uniref:Alpha/beta hydrolase n=1 Tax=Paenibacillus darwinianus TaxID=1380763 RepID=A0A9W5W8A4_9BACL|nr:alpha/beta hydrolase [Paenibacillus darwinianus]EXX87868.1 alpha/beta hydrolase [Paenibacillus darwinianus]EXX90533.1 alpha/beta hydrolase [Paenibacillus darwinianus]EXX90565.1 alpha/beta hydrolase [Paenibacillus darwinianus]